MQQTTNISSTFSEYCTEYCGFAFNGKEKDDETYGIGNEYDFGDRIYNPRIGKLLSPDAKENKFPSISPYAYALNSPIFFLDYNGEYPKVAIILRNYPLPKTP